MTDSKAFPLATILSVYHGVVLPGATVKSMRELYDFFDASPKSEWLKEEIKVQAPRLSEVYFPQFVGDTSNVDFAYKSWIKALENVFGETLKLEPRLDKTN